MLVSPHLSRPCALLSFFLATVTWLSSNVTAQESGEYPYIVIGAGISGLAAAKKLAAANGASNVLVLEGRSRTGGRVYTVPVGATIDIGASWINGTTSSPLTPIANQLGLTVSE